MVFGQNVPLRRSIGTYPFGQRERLAFAAEFCRLGQSLNWKDHPP
jgi:hypothetical protein